VEKSGILQVRKEFTLSSNFKPWPAGHKAIGSNPGTEEKVLPL